MNAQAQDGRGKDRGVIRGGLLSAIDQGLVSGCSFLTMIAAGRANGAEGLGAYALALSIVMTAGVVQGALLSKSYINLHRSADEPREFAGGALLLNIAFAVVSAALVGAGALLLRLGHAPGDLSAALLAGAAAMPFILVRDWLRQYLFAHLELVRVLKFDASWIALQLGGIAWLYTNGWLTAPLVFAPMGLAAAGVSLAAWANLRSRFAIGTESAKRTWAASWRFGSWTALSELCQQSRVHLVQWLVLLLHGLEAAGVFAAAMALVRVVNPLLLSISNFSEPYLAEAFHVGGAGGIRGLAPKIAVSAAAVAAPLCALAAWRGEDLIDLLFAGAVQVDGPVVAFLMAGAVLGLLVYPFSASLYAAGFPQITLWVRVFALAVAAVAAVALIPAAGARGAALSVLLSALAAAVTLLAVFQRTLSPSRAVSGGL